MDVATSSLSCPLSCASHVFRSSSLIKYTLTFSFVSIKSFSIFFDQTDELLPPGTLYTFDIFPEELHSSAVPWRDVTQHIGDERSDSQFPSPWLHTSCYRHTALVTTCGRCTDPWPTVTPGQSSPCCSDQSHEVGFSWGAVILTINPSSTRDTSHIQRTSRSVSVILVCSCQLSVHASLL